MNGDFGQFETKWILKHRSHVVTTEKCCRRVLGGETRRGALSESRIFSRFIPSEARKIDALRYRFPHTSAVSFGLPLFFFLPRIYSFLIFLLHLHSSISSHFLPLLYLSLSSIFHTWLVQLLSIRLRLSEKEEGGGKHFQILFASISQDSLGVLIQSLPAGRVDSDI